MERIASLIMMLCVFCISNAANYLTFTAEEDSSTFGIAYNYLTPDVQYSLDGGETWTELAVGDTILLAKKGDKAHIRGYNEGGLGSNGKDNVHFIMTGAIAASGSVMSLIDGIGLSLKIPKESCFWYLFENCTSLTQAPEVPATTLSEWCYYGMFSGCSSLTQAPELPATTLADWCYRAMFSGCTSLTKAPELPATELPDSLFMRSGCCESMFSGCTNLSEISIAFDKWNDNTLEWVADVAPTGTFICPKTLALEYGISRIPEGWTVKYIEDMANYLTFTAEEDSSTFGILNKNNNPDVQYSLDGGETWTALVEGDAITLVNKGDKALLRGDNSEGFSKEYDKYSSFTMTGKIAVSGSVMSLIDGTGETLVIPADYCFYSLFSGCTNLTQAPELPATTLADGCYQYMFSGCTSLTQAPELPATTLAKDCYAYMFRGCTSLTQAPELPATTLADYCYYNMFNSCSNLSKIKLNITEWDFESSTTGWVKDVAPTGTFICPKALAEEYGKDRIPEGWTVKYIEEGTGVNDAVASVTTVWTDGNTIYVRGAESDIEVYDMLGRLIVSKRGGQENIQISVPQKGIYVVKVGTETHKVELR